MKLTLYQLKIIRSYLLELRFADFRSKPVYKLTRLFGAIMAVSLYVLFQGCRALLNGERSAKDRR